MSRIWVASPLRNHTGGLKELNLHGETAGVVLESLVERYPALQNLLYDERGGLRPYVNIFVNDQDVRNLQGVNTPLREGDLLRIFPSISGGLGEERHHA